MSRNLLATVIALSLSAGCAPEKLGEEWQRIESPVEAPNFTLPQLDGPPVTLSDYRGRIVIMEFWATWCGPCRQSLPSLEVIARRYQARGVTVLLVNLGEPEDRLRDWISKRYTTPILLDQTNAVAMSYGVVGIPRTFVINQDGKIVYDHGGYGGGLEDNLTLILKELLAQTPAAAHGR